MKKCCNRSFHILAYVKSFRQRKHPQGSRSGLNAKLIAMQLFEDRNSCYRIQGVWGNWFQLLGFISWFSWPHFVSLTWVTSFAHLFQDMSSGLKCHWIHRQFNTCPCSGASACKGQTATSYQPLHLPRQWSTQPSWSTAPGSEKRALKSQTCQPSQR